MKQNELKILATWYGGIALSLLKNNAWNPDIDSNQGELLKQKFLKEAEITLIKYYKMNSGWWQVVFNIGVSYDVINSEGKDIKDCDLKAIIQHISRSK